MELKMILSIVALAISVVWDALITTLYLVHVKKGHKISSEQRNARKQVLQELKAKYKLAKKALNSVAEDSRGK